MQRIERYLRDYYPRLLQEPDGHFAHPYLTATPREGVYGGMLWDWDTLLSCYGYLALDGGAAAARVLRGTLANVLERLGPAGNSSMCLDHRAPHYGVMQGPPPHLSHIRPVLAQMALRAAEHAGDVRWLEPWWPRLQRAVAFYHRYRRHRELYCWSSAWESLADNNPALWRYPGFEVLACDASALVHQEYRAMAWLARELRDAESQYDYAHWARQTAAAFEQLWDEPHESFFNLWHTAGERLRRITYTNFAPFWIGVADATRCTAQLHRYLLNEDHLWCPYGVRTLSRRDVDYNLDATIAPSNWRGPVWFVSNYFSACALRRYGLQRQAEVLAERSLRLLDENLQRHGFVTENFHPETGDKLMADHFVDWTSIALRFEQDLTTGRDFFTIPD